MGSLNSKLCSSEEKKDISSKGKHKSSTRERTVNMSGKSTEEIEQMVSKLTNCFSDSSIPIPNTSYRQETVQGILLT